MQKYDHKHRDPKMMSRLFDLISEGHSDKEIANIFIGEGKFIGESTVKRYRRDGFQYLVDRKDASEKILNSIEKVTDEFEELYMDVKKLMAELSADPEKTGELLSTMRLLHDMLGTALKKLGYMSKMINAQTVNIQTNNNEFNMFIADLGAKVKDGKVVIENPKPELIEVLKRCEPKTKSATKQE